MNINKTEKAFIICGLSTGIAVLSLVGEPVGVYMWLISVLEKSTNYISQSIALLIVCGIGILGSLAASIVAKVKNKEMRWPVVNIVFISIMLVIQGLLTYGFIWLITQYV